MLWVKITSCRHCRFFLSSHGQVIHSLITEFRFHFLYTYGNPSLSNMPLSNARNFVHDHCKENDAKKEETEPWDEISNFFICSELIDNLLSTQMQAIVTGFTQLVSLLPTPDRAVRLKDKNSGSKPYGRIALMKATKEVIDGSETSVWQQKPFWSLSIY